MTTINLPDGLYPFIDERVPLAELTMVEAPAELAALLQSQAAKSGMKIIRDQPVELNCAYNEFPMATFLVWWPSGDEQMHILVPKKFAKGRA